MPAGNLYYFNPTCELAVANGSPSYQPPLLLQEMENSLSVLPMVFGTTNDFVLTENKPSEKFLNQLQNAGFELPGFYSMTELEPMPEDTFEALIPWGWSPAAHFLLKNLKSKCSDEFRKSPVFQWQDEHKRLFERSTSLKFLQDIIKQSGHDWIIPADLTGQIIYSTEELEILLQKHRQWVIKAPLSSSGRGIQMIRRQELDNARKQWISGILKQQRYIVAEPYLEKLTDFSYQFRVHSDQNIEFLGISFFETSSNGQYQRTLIANDEKILGKAADERICEKITKTAEIVAQTLSSSIYRQFHQGFLGIDAMIFRNNGQTMIQPCVEVNCRMNMGILALLLSGKIHPDCHGKFEIYYDRAVKFNEFVEQTTTAKKTCYKNGLIYQGILPLTDYTCGTKFGAYISVEGPK